MMSFAPTARAASSAPSITRCGRAAISERSLRLNGSPSAPFASTTAPPAARSATARHLRPTGKPAPPLPKRPPASRLDGEHPGEPRVGAGSDAVDDGDRPHQVGQPVHRPPGGLTEVRAEQARHEDRQKQIEGDHAETQPEATV